jgi:hypothetical protein
LSSSGVKGKKGQGMTLERRVKRIRKKGRKGEVTEVM